MVSFQCEGCGDVLTKKKLDPHRNRCRGATFSCIDCMVHFPGFEYRSHTSCMTEDQKYQGALYRNKKAKTAPSANTAAPPAPAPAPAPEPAPAPVMPAMAHTAYVEDVQDEFEQWREYEVDSDDDDRSVANLPEAPTPPSAAEANVNVFDFYVGNATPTASNISLPATVPVQLSEDTQLVRFDHEANAALEKIDEDALVQYGTGPVPTNYQTPAPKAVRKKSKDSDLKKDKKRKRLHIDTDHIMSDAPPVLHSGLTGGLNRLMNRPSVFPPSPDYSGGDVAETPASPLKKTKSKHHKHRNEHTISSSLMAMISTGTKPSKTKKRAKSSSTSSKKKSTKRLEAGKEQKMIEYNRPGSKDGDKEGGENQMVIFKPRAEQFFSYINKGPESERGCSINKVLKRYHRERSGSKSTNKLMEEKELWRTLRVRKNERGEYVLFSIEDGA
ncbi:hypothetical protein V8F06_001349 [Rhypophila decipiens]